MAVATRYLRKQGDAGDFSWCLHVAVVFFLLLKDHLVNSILFEEKFVKSNCLEDTQKMSKHTPINKTYKTKTTHSGEINQRYPNGAEAIVRCSNCCRCVPKALLTLISSENWNSKSKNETATTNQPTNEKEKQDVHQMIYQYNPACTLLHVHTSCCVTYRSIHKLYVQSLSHCCIIGLALKLIEIDSNLSLHEAV